jgi:uncharacterized membrane protein YhaH (DUF805 family)
MPQNTDSRIARWSFHRWFLAVIVAAAVIVGAQALLGGSLYAQKTQADFKDKLRWAADESGSTAVACSADGKYVFVAGAEGIVVSDNFGKTGSWTLVVKGK